MQISQVPPRGAVLSDDSPGNRPVSKAGGAECGTVGGVDLELVAVIQDWAELRREPEGRRQGPGSAKPRRTRMKMVRG